MKVRIVSLCSLISLCFLTLLSSAHAQFGPPGGGGGGGMPGSGGGMPQWVITGECSGTATATIPDSDHPDQQITQTYPIQRQGGSSIGYQGQAAWGSFPTAKATYNNTFQFHIRWLNPDGTAGSNPPKKVYLREDSGVHWNASSQHFGGTASANDQDGLDDPEAITPTGSVFRLEGRCSGIHLVQKNGSSGSIDVSITQSSTLDAKDGPPTSPGDTPYCSGSIWWGCGVLVDNRGLTLHRDNAINETVDDNGTVHGDTTYSFDEWRTGPDDSINVFFHGNTQVFHPAFDGGWPLFLPNPDEFDWKWAPSQSDDTWDTASRLMSKGNLHLDTNSTWQTTPSSPKVFVQSYTATDKVDGATATANYVLTKHDEVEGASDDVHPVTASGPLWGSDPKGGNGLLVVWGYAAAGSVQVTKGHEESSGWYIEANPDVPLLKFAEEFGIHLNFGYAHNNSTNVSVTVGCPEIPSNQYSYPIFMDTYNRHTVLFRHYLPEGEHKIHATTAGGIGYDAHHKIVADEYAGSSVSWARPQTAGTPVPIYDPSAPPPTPTQP